MTLKSLQAEFLKTKGSFALWFTLLSAIFIPTVLFLIYLFRYKNFIPEGDENIWVKLFDSNISIISTLLLPFYIVIMVALNLNIEHKSNSWKKILLLPISRASIYLTKVIFILLQIFVALLVFMLSILLFGLVLGFIHPELLFLEHSIDFALYTKLLIQLFISVLGIFAIQYFISLFIKNIIIPITTGTFLIIVSLIITRIWEYAVYFPYSFTSMVYYKHNQAITIGNWFGINMTIALSIGFFLVLFFIGLLLFKRKQFI